MLSQYSWGDLIKVVLVGLALYYAYVLIVYYREDIREWISNRGNKPDAHPSTDESDESDHSDLYAANHYGKVTNQPTKPSTPVAPATPDLSGVAIDQDELAEFTLPVQADVERPAERSIGELLSTAGRVQANQQGILVPTDASDTEAAKLADIINLQQGKSALSGIPFNR